VEVGGLVAWHIRHPQAHVLEGATGRLAGRAPSSTTASITR
jgi:hypothetical protein